jgi:DNA repair photolyase
MSNIIYTPKGKAREYAKYACNIYTGCSNQCSYCYLKKGIGKNVLGGNVPKLKKCFEGVTDFNRLIVNEISKMTPEKYHDIQRHGVFFSFITDPMLKSEELTTLEFVSIFLLKGIPVQILTKETKWFNHREWQFLFKQGIYKNMFAIGVTLTGRDDLEKNAATNEERLVLLKKLHSLGIRTFVSFEPLINVSYVNDCLNNDDFLKMVDLIKVGLLAGKKDYEKNDLTNLIITYDLKYTNKSNYGITTPKVYWKDSIKSFIGKNSGNIFSFNSVDKDFNIFNDSN